MSDAGAAAVQTGRAPARGERVKVLNDGSGPAAVAVDFRGGRTMGDFGGLLGEGRTQLRLLELVPPGLTDADVEVTASAYARFYADALEALDVEEVAVLGYCSGGPLAEALACELERRERPRPTALLSFDPVLTEDETVVSTYAELAQDAPPAIGERALELLRAGRRNDAYRYLAEDLRQRQRAQLESLGMDPDGHVGRDLVKRQVAWLAYVTAAGDPPPTTFAGRRAVFRSAHGVPAEAAAQAEVRDFDVARNELLRSDAVREAVIEVLHA